MKYRKLKVGDIIIVSSVLSEKPREYPVLSIEGNKAITDFRTFNTSIYPPYSRVYEFGKRQNQWDNSYYKK